MQLAANAARSFIHVVCQSAGCWVGWEAGCLLSSVRLLTSLMWFQSRAVGKEADKALKAPDQNSCHITLGLHKSQDYPGSWGREVPVWEQLPGLMSDLSTFSMPEQEPADLLPAVWELLSRNLPALWTLDHGAPSRLAMLPEVVDEGTLRQEILTQAPECLLKSSS